MRRLATVLLVLLAAGTSAQQEAWREGLESTRLRSRQLRLAMPARERAFLDALKTSLVGTQWAGELGLGRFVESEGELWFDIGDSHLPFLSMQDPGHWRIGAFIASSTGTADVTMTFDEQRRPIAMLWEGTHRFEPVPEGAFDVDARRVEALVRATTEAMRDVYVDEQVGQAIGPRLMARRDRLLAAGDLPALVDVLGAELRALTGDVQLGARFSALPLDPAMNEGPGRSPEPHAHGAFQHEVGIRLVTVLDANVGFLDVAHLKDELGLEEHLPDAMRTLAGTDALLLDLRRIHEGTPEAVALLVSYFVEGDVHLSDLVIRRTGEARPLRTREDLDGPRYLDRPLFVLVSADTFGAGEDVAYTLQQLGRAKVVGEPTAGGATPARPWRIDDHVLLLLPDREPRNAITGTHWGGVGVQPDVATDGGDAYARALREVAAALRTR